MKSLPLTLTAAISVIAIASVAVAHEMDTDQDGLYSLAEMRTEYPDLTEAEYAALDTNQDEAVDVDELAAAMADGTLAPME